MGCTHLFLIVALFFAEATIINGSRNQGRLLTPQEGCGFQSPIDKISMHRQTFWPWVGSLLAYSSLKMLDTKCTVTLISSRHALTSAKCASDRPLYVRLGGTRWVNYAVARWVKHPNAMENNIAILFLARNIEFSDHIRPACLPPKASILSERITQIYRLVREDSFGVPQGGACRPKNYTQIGTEVCASIHSVNLLDQTAFCAIADYKSGNVGDPFVVKAMDENRFTQIYQVGLDTIHSSVAPGIFLDLYPYVQWINDTITGKAAENIQRFRSVSNLAHLLLLLLKDVDYNQYQKKTNETTTNKI